MGRDMEGSNSFNLISRFVSRRPLQIRNMKRSVFIRKSANIVLVACSVIWDLVLVSNPVLVTNTPIYMYYCSISNI